MAPKKPVQHKSYRPQVKPELKKVEEAIELVLRPHSFVEQPPPLLR